ncbi:unnamed protein product [Hydatigera taeniaeformis]|uniref:MAP kinase-activating death domain protein n=1 Tax=Hydatigena taeniaeformis TaxID=6205 RepID=A0A158RDF0_HYDTA|nr:unnamed protein product [Hydatigera taeniaeformis]
MASVGPDGHYCQRLLDYFLIVGPQKNAGDEAVSTKTVILKQFPPSEHEDFPLPPETVYFCQPDPLTPEGIQDMYLSVGSESAVALISFCIITHHPMFSGFRRCLNTIKEMIDCLPGFGKLICGQSWNPENFWDLFLYGEWDERNITNAEALIAVQLERWILRLLSTPAPVPGCTYINLKLLPEEVEHPLIFAMPDKSRLSLVDFSFYLPMELLSISNCLQVILAILLEQKILVRSRDYNALTMCILALTKMLYPLQYMFPVIPLLPTSLPNAEQILLSPTPFLIGIPSSFLKEKGQQIPMAEILLVDLDSGQALELMKKDTSLSPDAIIDIITRPQRSSIDDSELGTSDFACATDPPAPVDVDVIDVATRVAMVRFFNSPGILGDFTEHTRTLRLFPRPVVTFQYISFMRSRPAMYPFTQKLAKTQAVEYLSEWCLYPENEVFQRIHAGISDPSLIGDKPKWFCSELVPVDFKVYGDSDTCVIHLGCCKNRNPWAVENIHLEPWLREKVNAGLLRLHDSPDQFQCAQRLLVNYREFFSAPLGVEEAIIFARAIRGHDVSERKGHRPLSSPLDYTTTQSCPGDICDDGLSSSLTESDDDSDKAQFFPPLTNWFVLNKSIDGTGRKANYEKEEDYAGELDLGVHILTNLSDAFSGANNLFSKILEKQDLLKQLTQAIWSGDKVGLRTKHEVQGLMEDERYRTYVLVKLLAESHEFHYKPGSHVPDVALHDIPMFRHLVWLTKAVICGYERNWLNCGIHGMGSAFLLLELAHTHFWDQSVALERELKASKQRPASAQGSKEDLFPAKLKKNPLESLFIVDNATEFKCRSSGVNRYTQAQLLRCTISQADLQSRHQPRYYVFEALIGAKERSRIWDQAQFWEDAFLDAAARERDLLGLDHSPTAMLERYAKLSVPEKKLWDLKEDRILATLLHNLIAFMVMLKTAKQEIYNVGYRLLGRCRLGSHFSHSISNLLESIAELSGNAVDLIPSMSTSIYHHAFIVTIDAKNSAPGTASILEVSSGLYQPY